MTDKQVIATFQLYSDDTPIEKPFEKEFENTTATYANQQMLDQNGRGIPCQQQAQPGQ